MIGKYLMSIGIFIIFGMLVVTALWMVGFFNFEFLLKVVHYGLPAMILCMVAGAILGGVKHL